MKVHFFLRLVLPLMLVSGVYNAAWSQQYKLRQSSSTMGMKSESTIYVKGMRKRTEPGKMMGMSMPVTIEQCDLQRTIKINDKKKLYFIEPFAKQNEEVIDEDAPKTKVTPAKTVKPATTQKGGVIEMWYTITDTNERKNMYGLIARHIWTYQKMKPSADACYMKDSMVIKTDGWYVDLPQFNCPVRYNSYKPQGRPGEVTKPDCMDRFVTHRKGKGKLGFPLTETTNIMMGGSQPMGMTEITTGVETLEFSAAKLDSMLFEIPPGYTETKDEADLQDKMDPKEMMKEYMKNAKNGMTDNLPGVNNDNAKLVRVGILQPTGGDGQFQPDVLQQYLVTRFTSGNIAGVAVTSEEDAKSKNCAYLLNTDFSKMKQASKVGGLLKAIKNADPGASTSFNIEGTMVLTSLKDNAVRSRQNLNDKYEGKADEAARKAADKGAGPVIAAIGN